jgi:hypothetical protein
MKPVGKRGIVAAPWLSLHHHRDTTGAPADWVGLDTADGARGGIREEDASEDLLGEGSVGLWTHIVVVTSLLVHPHGPTTTTDIILLWWWWLQEE